MYFLAYINTYEHVATLMCFTIVVVPLLYYHIIYIVFVISSYLTGQSHVLATLGTQDVITLSQEAAANQRDGALLAIEAVVMPLALLKGNVLAASKTYR